MKKLIKKFLWLLEPIIISGVVAIFYYTVFTFTFSTFEKLNFEFVWNVILSFAVLLVITILSINFEPIKRDIKEQERNSKARETKEQLKRKKYSISSPRFKRN